MNVTDLTHHRTGDRARELALWPAYAGLFVDLCATGHEAYDQKVLRRLWDDYVRDLPRAIRRREMMSL